MPAAIGASSQLARADKRLQYFFDEERIAFREGVQILHEPGVERRAIEDR